MPSDTQKCAETGACAQFDSDNHAGLALIMGDIGAVFMARLEYAAPSDWDMSSLNFLRHPMLLGAVGMLFMWQMKKTKKGGEASEVEAALREGDFLQNQ